MSRVIVPSSMKTSVRVEKDLAPPAVHPPAAETTCDTEPSDERLKTFVVRSPLDPGTLNRLLHERIRPYTGQERPRSVKLLRSHVPPMIVRPRVPRARQHRRTTDNGQRTTANGQRNGHGLRTTDNGTANGQRATERNNGQRNNGQRNNGQRNNGQRGNGQRNNGQRQRATGNGQRATDNGQRPTDNGLRCEHAAAELPCTPVQPSGPGRYGSQPVRLSGAVGGLLVVREGGHRGLKARGGGVP